ncbi:MAG: MarR family winged helix-turn-helix transcriptional regulator [Thiotrichales bacterium]
MNEKLFDLIERLGSLIRSSQRAHGMEHLQPVHWQVLRYLATCNRYSNTPSAVAAYLGVTKGTASQSLNVLVRNDLVALRPDPHDRRMVRLELTPKGAMLAADITARSGWMEAYGQLDPTAARTATATLEQLLRGLQVRNGHRSFGECRTCRHFQRIGDIEFRCGLTGEPLSEGDSRQICQEHALELS